MEKIKHVLFIVNPIAGDTNKNELINLVEAELMKKKIIFTLYTTSGENDQEKIKDLVSTHDFDRVFVAGGDGTIKMTAEAILDFNVPMALFPAGSSNGFALNFDLPDSPKKQLEIALGENLTAIDLIKINDHISLHLADFGINAELIENYDSAALRGKLGYLMQTIPTLINSDHPYHFEVETEEERFTVEGSVLSIANCQKYGTGACINPTGKPNDGKFEIIVFKNLNLIEIVKTFTNQVDLNPEFAEVYSVSSAKIKSKEAIPFQIDGEYLGRLKEVEVEMMDKHIQLCVPNADLVN